MDERPEARLERIRHLAQELASSMGAEARRATSVGIERAALRLVGVGGLDREGRPLAAVVVERAIGHDPSRLSRGVLLPFAAAVALYEAQPADVAQDVAGGAIDLDLESEALADPRRAAEVRVAAEALVDAALARIDANRTARGDLVDVLGDPAAPLVGALVRSPHVPEARDEVALLVAGGADVLRVEVPASRELADLAPDPTGVSLTETEARTAREARLAGEPAPTGSQRGLSEVRAVVDEAAAERRAYARIAAVPRALGVPELAIVAGIERLDLVRADPLAEIVADGVDPARALADHSFARRLLRRAGCRTVVDAGPLVVGPDFAAGLPATAAAHAGRAIALQALSVALARDDGLDDGDLLLGSLPGWMLDGPAAGTIGLAYLSVQRGLFPGLGLALDEPQGDGPRRDRWRQVRTLALVVAGGAALVDRDVDLDDAVGVVEETRAAAETAARLAADAGPLRFGPGLDETVAAIAGSACSTLEALRDAGWEAVLGPGAAGARLASATTATRSVAPDVAARGIAGARRGAGAGREPTRSAGAAPRSGARPRALYRARSRSASTSRSTSSGVL